jgi:hypothetical protein
MPGWNPEKNYIKLWERYKESYKAYRAATRDLFSQTNSDQRIKIVRLAFGNQERDAALKLTELMNVEERKSLLDILVGLTYSSSGLREFATKLILEIPHEWLVANIERYTEAILNQDENREDYEGFLSLLREVDEQLAMHLAKRAIQSSDPDIKELGQNYLT